MRSLFRCFKFRSDAARSESYRSEIDGLRALAILPVVFFHTNVPGFSGGFVGVDIFYVISGFLITSLIERERERTGFSFVHFYERRARRIFPALFGVVAFSLLAALILLTPADLAAFGQSVVSMGFFLSNVFFNRTGGIEGYFARRSDLLPLLHTWSLSVEEQFYLAFPALLMALTVWAKRWKIQFLSLAAAASFLLNLWATQHRPTTAFYNSLPRAWELLIGALLALGALPPLKRRAAREATSLAGFAMIVCAVWLFSRRMPFPGWRALVPCGGALLIIYSSQQGRSWVGNVLKFRPLVFIGILSYSLYLWHWPLLVFSRYFVAGDLNGIQTAAVIVLAFALAFLSFEFVESPFRGGSSRITRNGVFGVGLIATGASACFGYLVVSHGGFPQRYGAATGRLVSKNIERKSDYQEVCGNWRRRVTSLNDIAFCSIGSQSLKKVMFWGDSHVQQLYPLINKIYESDGLSGHGALFTVSTGCPPSEHMTYSGYYCDSFTRLAMERAQQDDIDTVFIGFATWWSFQETGLCEAVQSRCVRDLPKQQVEEPFFRELAAHIRKLRSTGKRVIVSLPFPIYDKSIPDLEVRNAVFGWIGLAGQATDLTLPSVRGRVASIAKHTGAEIFDPRQSLCPDQGCITALGGVSIYKDDNHLAASQVGLLEKDMERTLYAGMGI